ERWIDSEGCPVTGWDSALRGAARSYISCRDALKTDRTSGWIGLYVQQAQHAGIGVINVKGPHKVDDLSRREMAGKILLLTVSDAFVIDMILLRIPQRSPLTLGVGRA